MTTAAAALFKDPTPDVVNDLATGGAGSPLSAAQGVALKGLVDAAQATASAAATAGALALKLDKADVVDDLVTGGAAKTLSAAQGVVLLGMSTALSNDVALKLNIADVVNDLTTGGAAKALSATQGGILLGLTKGAFTLVAASSTYAASVGDKLLVGDNAIINLPAGAANGSVIAATVQNASWSTSGVNINGAGADTIGLGQPAITATSDVVSFVKSGTNWIVAVGSVAPVAAAVVNDLVSGGTTSALSAQQGVVLKDLIQSSGASIPGTAAPLVDGVAAVGTSSKWAHEDHIHPTDMSRVAVTDIVDDLTTGGAAKVLSGAQGVALKTLADAAQATAAAALPKAGGIMSGVIAMGGQKITGLANGAVASDAAAFGQIPVAATVTPAALGAVAALGASAKWAKEDHVHALPRLNQLLAPNAAVAMSSQKITGLATPTAGTDAATKAYVDSYFNNQSANEYYDIGPIRLQWGSVTSTLDGAQVFSLPASFANSAYSLNLTRFQIGVVSAIGFSAKTASTFTIDRDDTIAGSEILNFFAIGLKP
jgi:hypothetical protein